VLFLEQVSVRLAIFVVPDRFVAWTVGRLLQVQSATLLPDIQEVEIKAAADNSIVNAM
jgi:hypothetical protein